MSLGNVKSSGQWTNYPFQKAVVKLLALILEALTGGSLTVTGTFTASSTQRAVVRTVDGSGVGGTIPAGHKTIIIETDDTYTGTIAGATAAASRAYEFSVKQNNDTLGPISYTAPTGSVTITTIG